MVRRHDTGETLTVQGGDKLALCAQYGWDNDCPNAKRKLDNILVRNAFLIEYITLGWMVIEVAVAIGSAVEADSLALLAFGIDSLIERLSWLRRVCWFGD
jgi:hypothetical protein